MELINVLENIKGSLYSKNNLWYGSIISILVLIIITNYFKFDKSVVQGVLLIVLGIFVLEMFLVYKSRKLVDLNKITLYKLYSIQKIVYNHIESQKLKNPNLTEVQLMELKKRQKLDYLYMDANIINFLYDITYLNDYNPDVYFLMLKSINNILKLRHFIEYYYKENNRLPENCYSIYEQINIELLETMNYIHSFIFTLPKSNQFYNQHSLLQKRLFILLKRHSEFARKACELKKKQEGVNNDTKIIQKTDFPRGYNSIKESLHSHEIYV